MDVISHRSTSTLNPNAPLFVPLSYRTVEDFSDQWWALVQTSPWFRDYWLEERFHDPQTDPLFSDIYDPGEDEEEKEEVKGCNKELVSLGVMKWKKGRVDRALSQRHLEKAPKIVNVKLSPKMIQQPR
ncbi:unnamed protein product [Dovyalis caffra]|uniref:Ataxin-2 C-terminal domain-containing protein n=1 Tax=Dovyalis caffra TaxID=77055 RepID=A0AAV1R084_9ROSI|nr:unnamed protein product [Dovyalis caffra]